METQDKIWIDDHEWYCYYPVGVKCEEYIRKESLLEWAKEHKRMLDT